MTVLEAMNLLGLNERPLGHADLELAMTKALTQAPRQHELLEEAARCLSRELSADARQTHIERHPTREILLFDENRDAVMFGDEAPELPVAFHAPLMDDALWMGDDSVIFEGEATMMSELAQTAPDQVINPALEAQSLVETSVSGEWQLMLESLEAEGLIKPEEGFSDAISAQMIALHDTPAERLAVNPTQLESVGPIFAPLELQGLEMPTSNAALLETPLFMTPSLETPLFTTPSLETPLFTTPLFSTPLIEAPMQSASALAIPLFAASPLLSDEPAQAITFDESLLISHGRVLNDEHNSQAPLSQPRRAPALETLPTRKPAEATQLTIKPASIQPIDNATKPQATGRASLASAPAVERRGPSAKPAAPRTYRDAREKVTQVRRRRQPVVVWLLGIAALVGSAVFVAPNLAAQLRFQLTPKAAASVKPVTAPVVKPRVRVAKPAAITPVQVRPTPVKSSPAAPKPASLVKPAKTIPAKPSAVNISASTPSRPRAPVASAASTLSTATIATAAARVTSKPAPSSSKPQVRVIPASSVARLPPVTRPEGFASAVTKPVSQPVAAVKPAAKPIKPVAKPAPISAPVAAPVASIEFQDKPAAAQELPGGLSRQEFGRQFLNRKQFEVWQAQQLTLRFETFVQIPLEVQVLETEAFRLAVLVPTVRPARPERP